MISSYNNSKNQKIIPYLCKFHLQVTELQVQLYFPSSYQVCWKSKANQTLSSTIFKIKGPNNQVKMDEIIQIQTIMLYNKQSKTYIDKDTIIVVNYSLNSKPNDIKQLGKITLKMNKYMQEAGQSTLRKGETNFNNVKCQDLGSNKNINSQNLINSNSNRKLLKKNSKGGDDFKCLRLEGSLYNAKIKFKCTLQQISVSKISIKSLSHQEFNQNFVNIPQNQQINDLQKSKKRQSQRLIAVQPIIQRKSQTIKFPVQKIQKIQKQIGDKLNNVPTPKIFKSTSSQNYKQSNNRIIQDSNFQQNIPLSNLTQQLSLSKQHQQQLLLQLQGLQKQNAILQKTIQQIRKDFHEAQDELKQKQFYFEANLSKLEKMDHLKYQFLEMKEYVQKLQNRLIKKYDEREQQFKTGRPSSLSQTGRAYYVNNQNNFSRNSKHNKSNFYDQDNVRMSSFTIIDEQSLKQSKNIHSSQSFERRDSFKSFNKQSRQMLLQSNDYILTPSQVQLTNSQMRQVQGSTVRMQKQLSFIQIELYQLKAELDLLKQKYQSECHSHAESKEELFSLKQTHHKLQISYETLQTQQQKSEQVFKQLLQQKSSIHQQIVQKQKNTLELNTQIFKLRQSRDQLQYELNLIIKQQKIELQITKQVSKKLQREVKQLQQRLSKMRQQLSLQQEQLKQSNEQTISMKRQQRRLQQLLRQHKQKQEKITTYLQTLQGQINEVYKIVQEKEKSQEQLTGQIEQRDGKIQKLKQEIMQLQNIVKNVQMLLENNQKQLTLEKVKTSSNNNNNPTNNNNSNSIISISSELINYHQQSSSKQKQLAQKLLILQNSNKQLIQKNKQLINLVNKNATSLILFQKLKKDIQKFKQEEIQNKDLKKIVDSQKQHIQKLQKQLSVISASSKQIQSKLQQYKSQLSQNKIKLETHIVELQTKNLSFHQEVIKLKEVIKNLQQRISQKDKKSGQYELKFSKINKQKKLFEQTHKILQKKNKSYQSLVIQQQSTIQTSQSIIRELQNKIREYETYQIASYSHKNSSYGNCDGTSEIKLQSEISVSKKTVKENNNQKKQSSNFKKQQSMTIKNLLNQIQDLKGQLETYKFSKTPYSPSFSKNEANSKEKLFVLIQLIQTYLQEKLETQQQNQKFVQILEQSIDLKLMENDNKVQTQFIIKKAQQIYKQIAKYKAKILKQNGNNSNLNNNLNTYTSYGNSNNKMIRKQRQRFDPLNSNPSSYSSSVIESLKPVQNAVSQLINLTQNIQSKKRISLML